MNERFDVAIVGAGAAGLMAGIWAGRTAPHARVVVLEGARTLGGKILISGGGRCNVTHHAVGSGDFCGSTQPAIRKVLARYGVERTVGFFAELGVELKREETGKLFPVGDRARTVVDALRAALADAAGGLALGARVESVRAVDDGFELECTDGARRARRVVLATGGRSLARTGSDGHGYEIARSFGHSIARTFPALVPLRLPDGDELRGLSGLSAEVSLEVRSGTGKRLASVAGAALCTHFGLSGPGVLDVSRHWLAARHDDPQASLLCDWLPSIDAGRLDDLLRAGGPGTLAGRLRAPLRERLAHALCRRAGVDPSTLAARASRQARLALVRAVKECVLPVTGDRGWDFAEVTAGGVPLAELDLSTLESRRCPRLHLCGEILDVDGRIGGFNFQWAWASGFVAGTSAATALS